MMYRVIWIGSARDDLAEMWISGDSQLRNAITRATNDFDRALRFNPQDQGESRDDGERICFSSPLAISFDIDPGDRVVFVLQVWRIR